MSLLKTTEQRFWAKVQKTDSCWLWTASTRGKGYGGFWDGENGHQVYAHRFSFELANGSIPNGMLVCHHCDNPPCVNPSHLFLGTIKDNNLDMFAKGRGVKHSAEHFRKIGAKGGLANLANNGVEHFSKLGLKNGNLLLATRGVEFFKTIASIPDKKTS